MYGEVYPQEIAFSNASTSCCSSTGLFHKIEYSSTHNGNPEDDAYGFCSGSGEG
jgi:hypothetical protein